MSPSLNAPVPTMSCSHKAASIGTARIDSNEATWSLWSSLKAESISTNQHFPGRRNIPYWRKSLQNSPRLHKALGNQLDFWSLLPWSKEWRHPMGVGSNCRWIVRYWYKRSVKPFWITSEDSRAVANANRLQKRPSVSRRRTPTPTHRPTRRERSSTNRHCHYHCHHHRHRICTRWWRTTNWLWLPSDTALATTKTIVTVV